MMSTPDLCCGRHDHERRITKKVDSRIDTYTVPETIIVKGQVLSRCPGHMTTPENKHLYTNLSYFMCLAGRGDATYTYFTSIMIHEDITGIPVRPYPATWATNMDDTYDSEHESNPKGLIPTYHELDVIQNVFGNALFGIISFLDTRVCEKNPPIQKIEFIHDIDITKMNLQDGRRKTKLPPKWHMELNKDKTRYYYWNETERRTQWSHPWPTMMEDLKKRIHLFEDISDNFEKSIHAHMKDSDDFYKILGIGESSSSIADA